MQKNARLITGLLICSLYFSINPILSAQVFSSRIPLGEENYLQVVSHSDYGDEDNVVVVFFEVPDTVHAPLYFAIRDPEGNNEAPDSQFGAALHTSYFLIGGAGALSDPLSRQRTYPDAAATTDHLTGTILAKYEYDNTFTAVQGADVTPADDCQWVYFPGVLADQGELTGNRYYFKLVIQAQPGGIGGERLKNAFQLDVSYSHSGTPSGVPEIRAFAYVWSVCLLQRTPPPPLPTPAPIPPRVALPLPGLWSLYPFVPPEATGDIGYHLFDLDGGEILEAYRVDGSPAGLLSRGSELLETDTDWLTTFSLTSAPPAPQAGIDVNGTWELRIREDDAAGPAQNTATFWFTNDGGSGEIFRTYSTRLSFPAAAGVSLTSARQTYFAGETATVVLQVADSGGNPVAGSYTLDVQLNAGYLDSWSTPAGGSVSGGPASGNCSVLTDSTGLAWIRPTRTGPGEIGITLVRSFGSGTDQPLTLTFIANPPPVLSSAVNATLPAAASAVLLGPVVITDSGPVDVTAATGLRLQVPAGLDAVFTAGISINLRISDFSNGELSAAAIPLQYEDGRRIIYIPLAAVDPASYRYSLSGLQLDTGGDSAGRLLLDYGGVTRIADDKLIIIRDTALGTCTWLGLADSNWENTDNWAGGSIPGSDSNVIILASSHDPVLPDTVSRLASLMIHQGVVIIRSDQDLRLTGALNNAGRFDYRGDGSLAVDGILTNSGNLSLTTGRITAAGELVNHGRLNPAAGSLAVDGMLTNSGNLELTTGSLAVAGKLANPGNLSLTTGRITAAGEFVNHGRLNLAAGSLVVDGALTNSGILEVTTGRITAAGDFINLADFTCGESSVIFSGTCRLWTNGSDFYSLTIAAGASLIPQESLRVNRDFIILATGRYFSNGQQLIFGGTAGSLADNNPDTARQNLGAVVCDTTSRTAAGPLLADSLTVNGILDCAAFNVIITGTLQNNGTLRFQLPGSCSRTDTDSGVIEYYTSSDALPDYGAVDYFTLRLTDSAVSLAAGNTLTLGGSLIAGGSTLEAHGQPIVLQGDFDFSGSTYDAGGGSVEFTGSTVVSQISGENRFFGLICTADNKELRFTNDVAQWILPGGELRINGSGAAGRIILRSLLAEPAATPPDFRLNGSDNRQWQLVVDPAARLNVDFAAFQMCYAVNALIPDNSTATPWCYNVLTGMSLAGSWTEDSNADGRIDRIRVEMANGVNLNDDFSGLGITVNDGYRPAGQPVTGAVAYDHIFYINLEQGQSLDTAARPGWRITRNTSLVARLATSEHLVTTNGGFFTAYDGAAPLPAYTLAVAGRNEIFIHFSEYVTQPGGIALGLINFNYTGLGSVTGVNRLTTQDAGTQEVLLMLGAAITAAEIAALQPVVLGALEDAAGNPIPAALRNHRVSDLGLGLPGEAVIEPVYAADETEFDPRLGGIGIIHRFDGSQWLRDQNITLQVHIHDAAGSSNLQLACFFDAEVTAALKQGNLWLPELEPTRFNGLVPAANPEARALKQSYAGRQLRNFLIPAADREVVDGAVLEFLLQIADLPLYCAALADYQASNWYRQVCPWSFQIHDLIQQAGQITILNNVINPNLNQQTVLHYVLAKAGQTGITVFSLDGDIIQVLYRGYKQAGDYSIAWNGRNRNHQPVSRGLYFIRILAPGVDEIRKVLVVK